MQTSTLRPQLFEGKSVLVTGGATGLGFAMAEQLAQLGANIHLCGRRGGIVAEAAATLSQKYGVRTWSHVVDIRDVDAVNAMMDEIWRDHGGIDGLINNAAGNFISKTESLSPRGFNAIADIVFRGSFYVTQAAGKHWIATGRPGSVVSILVTWIWTGSPFVVPSAMSKAGLDAMTKSLAVEWGRYGIRLNAIAPGVIPTEGASARLRPKNTDSQEIIDQNPMKRLGTGQDIGDLAAFLLAEDNGWINGQTIALDGADWLANGAYYKQYFDWTDEDWSAARMASMERTAGDKQQRTAQVKA
ncbi:SDR family oxidoreductase [Pusillimonas sp. ANT_WB101]|uniref:SDR family oxidoreductase n=1 Tax=Pusillimonas sp. ANT_WB101 TaxID=2597356 RepID=UPI0011EEE802|nr:SDR family oxidoreductase [Pusillimonas sp. ANT_WB101]KAA0889442.1 SDR family oxidoreductase [Pusillimonas sp. ANT_WB101]